ncbi:MAG: hypothetical protein RLZZ238_2687 [Planctomycetota bacterium]|jgi:outer membrane protein TolC
MPFSNLRRASVALAVAAGASAFGCRQYQAKPLALDESQRAFLARSIDGPSISEFGAKLAAHAPGAPAFDPADGISLAEAEAIAVVMNADLRAERLAAGVTRASLDNAGLWRDPTLGVDLSQIVDGAGGGVEAMFSLGLTLPLSGRREAERATAGATHAAELARIEAAEWQVRTDLRRAWTERAALVADEAASRDILARIQQVLAVVDRMESVGEIARIEARLLRIEEVRLRVEVDALEAEVLRATHAIDALIGLPARSEPMLDGAFPRIELASREGQDEIAGRMLEGSPELRLARARYEVAERRLAAAVEASWPELAIAPGFGEQDGNREAVLGIGVTLPILDGNRREIAEAEAERELSRARVEALVERALGELLAAEDMLRSAAARREVVESTLVPLVDTQYAEAREVARLGEVNTIILLESLKAQLDARRRLIATYRDEALAAVELARIVGPTIVRSSEGQHP